MISSLALHEFRVLLAYVLWHFDVSLVDPNFRWLDQDVHELWVKNPLLVRLEPVQR